MPFLMPSPALFIAFLGGLMPALVWLFFWLFEDRCEPEPKRYILLSFVCGIIAVPFILPVEQHAAAFFSGNVLLLIWAASEELFKFAAAYFGGLRWRAFDEPLDAVIYMVTAALGFSAAENALFMLSPLLQGDILRGVVMIDLRFIGASLLHTLASATIGISIALAWSKGARVRREAALGGVILAVLLHWCFNIFILGQGPAATFWVFLAIWIGVVVALLFTERVKLPQRDYC